MTKRWPLFLLFVLLAAVAFWLWRSNRPTTLAGNMADFVITDTAAVSRIFIADKGGATIDIRRDPQVAPLSGWTVNGLPADQAQINTLLKTFLLVEVRTPVPKSAEANVLKVMAGTAKKVEIYQGGEQPVKVWWVGHATMEHLGTYMLLEKPGVGKSAVPFVTGMAGFIGVLTTRFHTKLDDWRSKALTRYPDLTAVEQVTVEHPSTDSAGFTITFKGGNDLALFDAQGVQVPMDSARVKEVLLRLRSSNYESIERGIDRAQRDSVLATPPWHVLTISGKDGQQRIRFWKKDPRPGERDMDLNLLVDDRDRMYALQGDTTLVIVQRYWFDPIVTTLGRLKGKGTASGR